jgi:hypothetical protein
MPRKHTGLNQPNPSMLKFHSRQFPLCNRLLLYAVQYGTVPRSAVVLQLEDTQGRRFQAPSPKKNINKQPFSQS